MDLRENIEQLSFGRSLPRLSSCLGLYISPDLMFLAEATLEGGKPKVLHLLRLPVPGGPAAGQTKTAGTLNTDFLQDPDRVAGLLQEALGKTEWSSKHVMVTLSHHFGILRYFTLPAIDRRFWKTAVPVEAKKYIPIPFASLENDYQVREVPPGHDRKPRLGSLFGVTHKSNLAGIRKIVEKLGLTLVGTEIAPCSMERLWDTLEPDGRPYTHVHFDGGHIRILVSEGGLPIFFREVFLPDGATVMERRKVDVNGCIDFTRKQLGAEGSERVRLSGTIPDLPAWQQAFGEDTGKPVDIQQTDQLLGIRGGQWGGYAAVGAALRHLGPGALTLDLSAVGKISEEDRRAATAILGTGLVLAAAILLLGGVKKWQVSRAETELAAMKSQGGGGLEAVFRNKNAGDISMMIDSMRDRVNSFGALTAQQTPLTSIFAAIAEAIPDAAWISDISYDNPLSLQSAAQRQPRELKLDGSVQTKSRAEEQDIGYQFAERLRSDERIQSAFPFIEPSIQAPAVTGPDGEAEGNKPTTFTIKCVSSKERVGT